MYVETTRDFVKAIATGYTSVRAEDYRGDLLSEEAVYELASRVRSKPVVLVLVRSASDDTAVGQDQYYRDTLQVVVYSCAANARSQTQARDEAFDIATRVRGALVKQSLRPRGCSEGSFVSVGGVNEEVNVPELAVASTEFAVAYTVDSDLAFDAPATVSPEGGEAVPTGGDPGDVLTRGNSGTLAWTRVQDADFPDVVLLFENGLA